jgi:ABC-type polysaccharide/polyol phosphate transport system ATPase subunit
MAQISARNLEFRYPIYSLQAQSFRSRALSALTGRRIHGDAETVPFVNVFSDVSFEFKKGDRVALLGKNGAGKSSMLKMLAGIYAPWAGELYVDGDVGALLEVGGGMDVDLTARENIIRAGILNHMRIREVTARMAEMEDFVGIGRFFDMPVRTYSAGMTIRVAFAMSTLTRPKIFLIDEVFGVGDFEFQKKAEARINGMIDGADILVFSSHSMQLVRSMCNRALLLESGKIKAMGGVEEVISAYLGQ